MPLNHLKQITLLFLFFLVQNTLIGQNFTVYGYVTDNETGEKLSGSSIYIEQTKKYSTTNDFGFFSLTLPKGNYKYRFSYLGFQSSDFEIFLDKDTLCKIQLNPSNSLKEVEIIEKNSSNNNRNNAIQLTAELIKSLPSLGGEADVLKTIQRLPGVKFGNEGTTGLFVRGGTPDQNLILFDGVPVYNVSHLFGFVSVFNPSSLSHLEVIKSGFPARYGGRLASVIDIQTKDGNKKEFHGALEMGIISSKFFYEGPIIKNKSSFAFSLRRSLLEVYTLPKKWISGENQFNNFNFYDFNLKFDYSFSQKDKLFFSSYFGKDGLVLKNDEKQDSTRYISKRALKWGNQINSLRWNHLWGERMFSNMTLYSNNYSYSLNSNKKNFASTLNETLLTESNFNFTSQIKDIGLNYDCNFYPNNKHDIRFGTSLVRHIFKPGVNSSYLKLLDVPVPQDTLQPIKNINTLEARAYLENTFKVTNIISFNLGTHASLFRVREKTYTSLEPRVSFNLTFNKNWRSYASFTAMKQYLHLLTNSGLGIPADLWVPPTDKIAPQNAWQTSIGLGYRFNERFDITFDAYYKEMKNLIDYKPGSSFLIEGQDWENKVVVGNGDSYGAEVFLRSNRGRYTVLSGYTLAWSNRTFPDIDNGKTFPFRYDRRHDFQISGIYRINKTVNISLGWIYTSGNPVTIPISVYPSLVYPPLPNSGSGSDKGYEYIEVDIAVGSEDFPLNDTHILHYGTKNNQRMPDYHRLDVGLQFVKKKKKGERTWSIQVYNLYNQINPYYIKYAFKSNNPTKSLNSFKPLESRGEFRVVSLFQIIPSLSYAFKF
jgi:CarboxypepD_reg-like domain/TonB-dependent Receptor Plug Domain